MTTMPTADPELPRIFRFADLELDEGRQLVLRKGIEVPLPKLSFDLLLALLEAAPNFMSNKQLMARVWPGLVIGEKTVSQRVKLLRDALGDDHEEPRYVAGLRGRGYRIQAPVTHILQPAEAGGAPLFRHVGHGGSRRRRLAMPGHWSSLTAGLTLLAVVAWWLWSGVQAPTNSDLPSSMVEAELQARETTVAVLPFRDLSGNAEHIALGLPEVVIDSLSTLPQLSVIARSSSFRATNRSRDVQDIGRLLGAQYLVDGSVQLAGDTLRVSVKLVDSAAGRQVWAQRFDRNIDAIFEIQDEIAASVAGALSDRVEYGNFARAVRGTNNVEAHLAYLRGRALLGRWTLADAEAAVQAFESAIELDPHFAAAYASLYDARLMVTARRCGTANAERWALNGAACPLGAARAEHHSLIERALALDPRSGAAYFARAIWADDTAQARDADFRRGLELDPSNGRGITAYAEFLDRSGRGDEAARMLERAIRIDPLSARPRFWRVMRVPLADVATREAGLLGVLEVDPDYVPALQRYAKYRWILHGELAQAIRLIEHALSLDPRNPWLLHTAIAMYLDIGDVEAARALQTGVDPSADAGRILMLLYHGDALAAGDAALAGLGFANGFYENWGVYEALRERAVASRDYAGTLAYLEQHVQLGEGDVEITIENFRAAPAVAQVLIMAGQPEPARALLEHCVRWIDEVHLPRMGSVYALRIKAQALLMLGETDRALDALEASFLAHDYVQWWYTIDRDPLWEPIRREPRFQFIADNVRQHVAEQRRALELLQRQGAMPRRSSSRTAGVGAG